MAALVPSSPAELAEALETAAAAGGKIRLDGASTKTRLAPPPAEASVHISTSGMRRVLQYEPADLTISVEAGLPFRELDEMLRANQQMVPLDPPHFDDATVGGVVAVNAVGPRRRLYGSARDLIIGMQFATLEGKLINSGGMVVKNVAGLDMAKLMVGSFGTLAAIAVVNFKLVPRPARTGTWAASCNTSGEAIRKRDAILNSFLQPAAVDVVNPAAAERLGRTGYQVLVQAGGNEAVIERYTKELGGYDVLEDATAGELWTAVREFSPRFAAEQPEGATVRASTTLAGVGKVLDAPAPVVSRSANGVSYLAFADAGAASEWMAAESGGARSVIEYGPEAGAVERWRQPGTDFAMMEKVKDLFDPNRLLNPGRLYGRL